MNDIARIYRAEILRAVLGPGAHSAKAVDLHRLNQLAEHMAACEEAQTILRAKGHGGPGTSIVESARQVPANVKHVIRVLFSGPAAPRDAGIEQAHEPWKAT
jgi:predicted glycosyltransferase